MTIGRVYCVYTTVFFCMREYDMKVLKFMNSIWHVVQFYHNVPFQETSKTLQKLQKLDEKYGIVYMP